MADTSVQTDVARWICDSFVPRHYGQPFARQRVPLITGGSHSFAGVSLDGLIVGSICTGSAATSGQRLAVGKLNKVRADLYFLLLAVCETRFIAVTQPVMHELLLLEQTQYKRIPADVEILRVELPRELLARLVAAQREASLEVTPA
jgi:hypothetical protein